MAWAKPGPGARPRISDETIAYILASPDRKAVYLAIELKVSKSYINKVRNGTRRGKAK